MHKTFISYHHANEQDLKDEIIQSGAGDYFIDKSVNDGDIDIHLSEDTIMRKIREDYIGDSTVVVVLIGEETSDRPYVNSEIQAAMWGNSTGLIGIVRDELYDRLYDSGTCNTLGCNCGISLRIRNSEFGSKVPYLVKENNTRLESGKSTAPHYNDSEAYCGIYKYSLFMKNIETYIDEAFNKREKDFDVKKSNGPGVKTITRPNGY